MAAPDEWSRLLTMLYGLDVAGPDVFILSGSGKEITTHDTEDYVHAMQTPLMGSVLVIKDSFLSTEASQIIATAIANQSVAVVNLVFDKAGVSPLGMEAITKALNQHRNFIQLKNDPQKLFPEIHQIAERHMTDTKRLIFAAGEGPLSDMLLSDLAQRLPAVAKVLFDNFCVAPREMPSIKMEQLRQNIEKALPIAAALRPTKKPGHNSTWHLPGNDTVH